MPSRADVIESLAPKYVWWTLDASGNDQVRRVLAQVMNLGTYDDILAIEAVFARDDLIAVMAEAQPGWFSPRSWDFWRGRLAVSDDTCVATRPPRRLFGAETLPSRA